MYLYLLEKCLQKTTELKYLIQPKQTLQEYQVKVLYIDTSTTQVIDNSGWT
jgi:hypothetical protein